MQVHSKEPGVLVHVAFASQLAEPELHSSMSLQVVPIRPCNDQDLKHSSDVIWGGVEVGLVPSGVVVKINSKP